MTTTTTSSERERTILLGDMYISPMLDQGSNALLITGGTGDMQRYCAVLVWQVHVAAALDQEREHHVDLLAPFLGLLQRGGDRHSTRRFVFVVQMVDGVQTRVLQQARQHVQTPVDQGVIEGNVALVILLQRASKSIRESEQVPTFVAGPTISTWPINTPPIHSTIATYRDVVEGGSHVDIRAQERLQQARREGRCAARQMHGCEAGRVALAPVGRVLGQIVDQGAITTPNTVMEWRVAVAIGRAENDTDAERVDRRLDDRHIASRTRIQHQRSGLGHCRRHVDLAPVGAHDEVYQEPHTRTHARTVMFYLSSRLLIYLKRSS